MRSAPRDDAPRVLISHSVHVRPGVGQKPFAVAEAVAADALARQVFSSELPSQPACFASSFVTKFDGRQP